MADNANLNTNFKGLAQGGYNPIDGFSVSNQQTIQEAVIADNQQGMRLPFSLFRQARIDMGSDTAKFILNTPIQGFRLRSGNPGSKERRRVSTRSIEFPIRRYALRQEYDPSDALLQSFNVMGVLKTEMPKARARMQDLIIINALNNATQFGDYPVVGSNIGGNHSGLNVEKLHAVAERFDLLNVPRENRHIIVPVKQLWSSLYKDQDFINTDLITVAKLRESMNDTSMPFEYHGMKFIFLSDYGISNEDLAGMELQHSNLATLADTTDGTKQSVNCIAFNSEDVGIGFREDPVKYDMLDADSAMRIMHMAFWLGAQSLRPENVIRVECNPNP